MKEIFDKLDNYESRFSDSVWVGVNQHLEAQRAKKRRTRILYISSLLFFVGFLTISYVLLETPDQVAIQSIDNSQIEFATSEKIGPVTGLGLQITKQDDMNKLERVSGSSIQEVAMNESTSEAIEVDRNTEASYQKSEVTRVLERRQPNIYNTSTSKVVFSSEASKSTQSDDLLELTSNQSLIERTNRATITEIKSLPTQSSHIRNSSLKSLFIKEGCDLLGSKPFKSYAWSQLSTFAPLSQINAKTSDDRSYATARELSETALPSVEIGFGLGLKTKSGVFAESGLQLAVWREKLSYIDPESIGYQTVITIDTMFTSEGIEINSDTTSIQINGSTEIVNFNSHRTVSVPLIVGYEKPITSQLSIAMRVGAILNIATTSEGRILDQQMNVIDINQNDSTSSMVYNTKLSTQLMAGGQLVYHFSPALDIYVNPEIRFTPKSNTVDTYTLNQRFVSPTIGAGLRYYF